ncbi:glycosyltransferase family 4 protein [Synechocystis salina LEGE 06155]|nr:glycosyltransferase family 4 protein [Synechocystis salina LEGE 06155]
MKILFVIPEYPPHYGGGIASFYQNLLPNFIQLNYQATVLVGSACTATLPSYVENHIKVSFLDTDLVSAYLHKFSHYKIIPELQKHLAAAWAAWEQTNGGEGYDLVETTDWGMLFVPWVVMENSPPSIVQLHASVGQIDFYDPSLTNPLAGHVTRLLESGLLSAADEIQANSLSNAKEWQQITGRRVRYIPPALPLTPEYSSANTNKKGLVVGRIQYWKGVTILCEALQQLGHDAPDINWVGRDVTYQTSQQSMSAYLGLHYPEIWGKKIHPLGTFPPEETRQLQSQAPFILVPSIWDVFNYTCAEAMALARPVLCSKGAGASDLIEDGVNGFTFEPNDPTDLAGALQKVMSLSEQERETMGKAAQATVANQLNPAKVAQQRIEAYEDLIERGKWPKRPHQWLIDAVSPQEAMARPLAFLDQLPLKELTGYVSERFVKKITKSN